MPKINVLNIKGDKVGEIELNAEIFGVEVNEDAMHRVVVNQLANKRQGTQSTKTRAEVRGGGRKPWRQKGTGRARQGSIRSPQWTHGGIAFGPKPRDYSYTLNKKLKRIAIKSAFTVKCVANEIVVLDQLNFTEYKTKAVAEMLKNVNAANGALVVIGEKNDCIIRSTDNIPGAKAAYVNTINVYDLLKYNKLVITKEAIEKVQEVYV